jgi:hypothetical protein
MLPFKPFEQSDLMISAQKNQFTSERIPRSYKRVKYSARIWTAINVVSNQYDFAAGVACLIEGSLKAVQATVNIAYYCKRFIRLKHDAAHGTGRDSAV